MLEREISVPLLIAGLVAASPVAKAASLVLGNYAANVYVAEAFATAGGICPDRPGSNYLGALHYGGINAPSLTVHFAFAGNPAVVSRQTLTITDGTGTTTPQGTFVGQISTGGSANGTFSAVLSPFDGSSFTALITETAPALGCTERFEISLVRLGK
jgi:hypothetical protein